VFLLFGGVRIAGENGACPTIFIIRPKSVPHRPFSVRGEVSLAEHQAGRRDRRILAAGYDEAVHETLTYTAPWGKLLWTSTLVASAIMLAVPFFLQRAAAPRSVTVLFGGGMVLTWVVCALFAVKGYRLEDGDLVIERPLWEKRVPLAGLRLVRHSKNLMRGAIRVGNGGLFVFAGWYWSSRHGWFHLAGNDILGRAVILEWRDKKWIITPENPLAFVREVEELGL